MNRGLFIVALLLSQPLLIAGPFGLKKGMRPDEIQGLRKVDGRGMYELTEPPNPHPKLQKLRLIFSERSGLAKIIAASDLVSTSRYGEGLRAAYEELAEALAKKYGGGPKITEFLQPGSVWDEPNDWMTALTKDERYHFRMWSKANGLDLPDEIQGIMLRAVGMSAEAGMVFLAYEFDNFSDYTTEENEAAESAL